MNNSDFVKVDRISESLGAIANAIFPSNALPGSDPSGGVVTSLTEAIMGISHGLYRVAESLDSIAGALRHDKGDQN